MNCYRLADRLRMTLDQVLDMPADHFAGWLAFYNLRADEEH